MLAQLINYTEKGLIPDTAIRFGIKQLCKLRLKQINAGSVEKNQENYQRYVESLKQLPLAVHTKDANTQHYEVPSEFYFYSLGKNLKYSSCYWTTDTKNLDEAEDNALMETIKRAEIKDGHHILELGCGWGSLTLKMAETFKNCKITAISNSKTQKAHIDAEAKKRNLNNIEVLTKDLSDPNNFDLTPASFDRVVSVEMFEHFKNYEMLLEKISFLLSEGGKLFVHIFTHQQHAYPFEVQGEDNWMGKYFFTGGQMPSHNLLLSFQKNLSLEKSWVWDGTHYEKTSNAWLENLDKNREKILPVFKNVYGADAEIWIQRWRMFFMACAELFGYQNGQEWGVSHYLFIKK